MNEFTLVSHSEMPFRRTVAQPVYRALGALKNAKGKSAARVDCGNNLRYMQKVAHTYAARMGMWIKTVTDGDVLFIKYEGERLEPVVKFSRQNFQVSKRIRESLGK